MIPVSGKADSEPLVIFPIDNSRDLSVRPIHNANVFHARSCEEAWNHRGYIESIHFCRQSADPDEPTEPQPVRAHVYRTIAEMNGGLEQVIEALQTLKRIKHLPGESINWIENQIAQIRAEANRDLMAVLSDRELANVGHFHRLCLEPPAKP